MNYRIKMSGEQVRALAEWAAHGDGFADVLLDDADDDRIVAGQGDERVTFNTDGVECCERCGALAGEELQGGACYSCGFGHEDDPEATLGEELSRRLESTGERIARMGRELIDPTRAAAQDDPRGERDR